MTIAVSNTGPLIALAKIQALDLLLALYRKVYVPPSVYQEAVIEGMAQKAPDALLIQEAFTSPIFEIHPLEKKVVYPALFEKIHVAEQESILLAIQLKADVLLIDDWNARLIAEDTFHAQRLKTEIKGTLGVITTAFIQQILQAEEAIQLLERIKLRRDIWIHPRLCDQVIQAIRRASHEASAGSAR